MSSRKSILMLSNTGDGPDSYTVYGDKIRSDSYYGHSDGLMTVQVVYSNYTGGFGIQATLALDPQEEDWFWIQLNYLNGQYIGTPYATFPENPLSPTGSSGNSIQNVGDTGSRAYSLVINCTYLRAVCYRDYIDPPPSQTTDNRWYLGQIDKVLLSL